MGEIRIRWAALDDAPGIAEVHVASWRGAYRGLLPDEVLAGLSVERRTEGWSRWLTESLAGRPTDGPGTPAHRLLVAVEPAGAEVADSDSDAADAADAAAGAAAARIVGWAGFGAGRDEGQAHLGELAGLYVHPDRWSHRVGHALTIRAEEELVASGFARAYLWVLDGNARAARFYERHGWLPDGTAKIDSAGGVSDLPELRHVRALGSSTA